MHTKIKTSTACLLLLCVLLSLTACDVANPPPVPKQQVKIGISVYDQFDTFIGVLMGYFRTNVQKAQRDEGITYTLMEESAGGNQATQNSQIESFIAAGCDIICVNLVDRTEASTIIEAAKAANIPVLFFNRELVEEDLERWDQLYYVGAPASQSGVIQGEIILDICRKTPERIDKNGDGILQYTMLEGEAGHQDAIVRTEHSVGTVQKCFPLERLEDEIANWNRAQAETKMTQWIEEHGQSIEVVFANNDDMALGAIDALKKAEIPQDFWPMVVGIDGTPVGLAAVAAGEMAGTVYNDAAGQANALFTLARSLVIDGAPASDLPLQQGKYIRLDYMMITKENVEYYLKS